MTITPDDTLLTIHAGLDQPEAYVRKLLLNLRGHGPNARVRIEITDRTGSPNYIIDDVVDAATGARAPIVSFSGKTHLASPPKITGEKFWANSGCSRQEVSALLGKLRNFQQKPRHIPKPGGGL